MALHDVKVSDPKLLNVTPIFKSGDINNNKLLDEGEEWVYEAVYFITQEDIDNAEKVNQATVTALTDSNKVISKISGTDYTNENPTIVPLPFGAVDDNFCDNEGDQFISGFHTTIVKTKYGFEIFGERGMPNGTNHVYSPLRILPKNGYDFKGSPMLATMGTYSNTKTQMFLLTSKGLYVWGTEGTVISTALTKNTSFGEISLPANVKPRDVVYMTASYNILVLKTKQGKLYTMGADYQMYGDGSLRADNEWHIVKRTNGSELTDVKLVRVHSYGGFALLNDDSFIAWGKEKYDGQNPVIKNNSNAINVKSPYSNGEKPKMIAVTGNDKQAPNSVSYLVLGNNGKVYSIGGNNNGQLGIGESGKSKFKNTWQVVKSDAKTELSDIIFITGADNSSHETAAGAIDRYGKLYLWGKNGSSMLGQPGDSDVVYASVPQGFLDKNGKLVNKAIYVEIGGHTSMYMGENYKFCYIGHKTNGSMGDGTRNNSAVSKFDCENTPHISEMCAKLTIEPEPGLSIIKDGEYIGKGTDKAIKPGGVIRYTIKVTNTGNTLLTNIEVTDPKLPDFKATIASLLPGELKEFSVNTDYVITQADIERGGVFNQAVGKGNIPTGPVTGKSKPTIPVDKEDPNYPLEDPAYKDCETCTVTILEQQPSITLVKVGVVDEDADTSKGNGVINYTFTITNTGNVSLTLKDFKDSKIPKFTPVFTEGQGTGSLEVGKTWTATATYTITDTDVDAEKVENRAEVTGTAPKGKTTTAESKDDKGFDKPTITPVEGGGPLMTNPHIYHKVQ
ncbi:DUF7507 domain-containing protein [Myroides albus]